MPSTIREATVGDREALVKMWEKCVEHRINCDKWTHERELMDKMKLKYVLFVLPILKSFLLKRRVSGRSSFDILSS